MQNTEEQRPNPSQDPIEYDEVTTHTQKMDSTITKGDQILNTTQNIETHDNTPQNNQIPQTPIQNADNNNDLPGNTQSSVSIDEIFMTEDDDLVPKKVKRNATSISSIDELIQTHSNPPLEDNKNNNKSKQSKQKKKRTDSPGNEVNLNETLQTFKTEMETNPKKYSITYEDLCNLTEEIQTSTTPLVVARKYTKDLYELIVLLKDLHASTVNRSAKTKITKIINRLREDMMEEADNVPPSQSQQSCH